MWENDVAGVEQLAALDESGAIPPEQLLTAGWNLPQADLTAPSGVATIEAEVLAPIEGMVAAGLVVSFDLTSLVTTWLGAYGGLPSLYRP